MNSNHKGPLVLSIDDDPVTLKLIGKLLSRGGYNVIAVNSGLKGLQVISKNRPDLILLDVEMPGMDGYEVCARLQKCKATGLHTCNIRNVFHKERRQGQSLFCRRC